MTHDVESEWQHQFIETNRVRLHCVTQGEGDLVLLLHGFPEFWYAWRFQLPVLARHFKVVVPDLRGHNESDKPTSGYDVDTLSADVIGLIQALGYQQASIVGHDCGGLLTWHLAHKFPQYLQRVAILSAPHPNRLFREFSVTLEALLRNWYVLALQMPGVPEYLLRANLKQFLQNWFQQNSVRKGAFSSETLEIYQAALEKAGALTSILSYYRQLLSPQAWLANLWRRENPITIPTLVLWGEQDQVLSPQLTEGLEDWIKAPLRLRLLPDCGHWTQQEVPNLVNRELLEFLRPGQKSGFQISFT
jgi:epoxide hydrolase 4